jgi:hypothetical protein
VLACQQSFLVLDEATESIGCRPMITGSYLREARKMKTLRQVPVVQSALEVAFNRSREAVEASRREPWARIGQLQKPLHFGVPLSVSQATAFRISSRRRGASTSEWLPFLRREGTGVLRGSIDPCAQLGPRREPLGPHQDPSFHRTSRQIKYPRVWLRQRLVSLSRVQANDQGIAMNTATHIPVQEKGDPAKHPFLD